MQENLRLHAMQPEPDLDGEGCASAASSSVTADSLRRSPNRSEDVTELDSSTEWTNEKHNLYLNFLEASFVDQLHKSMGFLAWCLPRKSGVSNSCGHMPRNYLDSSNQFTVLQDGCGQKINFQRSHTHVDAISDFPEILESPWIRHFSSVGKSTAVKSSDRQERYSHYSFLNQENGKSCGEASATSSVELSVGQLCDQVPIDGITEGSGQNFVNEDQTEKLSDAPTAKRLRTSWADALWKDQIVPCGKLPVEVESTAGTT